MTMKPINLTISTGVDVIALQIHQNNNAPYNWMITCLKLGIYKEPLCSEEATRRECILEAKKLFKDKINTLSLVVDKLEEYEFNSL